MLSLLFTRSGVRRMYCGQARLLNFLVELSCFCRHLQTLPLKASWDQTVDEMLARELEKMPGSFPSS